MSSSLEKGTIFENKGKLVAHVKEIATRNHFELKTIKSDTTRYTVTCNDKDCSWRLHASTDGVSQLFIIKRENISNTPELSRNISDTPTFYKISQMPLAKYLKYPYIFQNISDTP